MELEDVKFGMEIKVLWRDIKSYNGEWCGELDIATFNAVLCRTKGWIVHVTEALLMIAQTVSEFGAYNIMVIPKGCVVEIKEDDSSKN